ncbi:BACON domain-containing protein [uncultured Bacteroides sp.]|uniref:BACON domain-containing protein n=1 Tax=uncultured Bacteroides sp. TaxID=162156 RepID=UPI0025D4300E|nr:BACON domain-containing protein [uncultured Bacteroides sp.]
MKKIIYILWAVSCVMMTACSEDDSIVEITSLNIVESVVDFDATGGEGFLKVENGSNEMNVTSNTDWCVIKDVTSDKVTFVVDQNNDIVSRSALIKLEFDGQSKQVAITQAGGVSEYESGVYKRFGNDAFNADISVTSTLPITVSISDDAKDWLNYKAIEGGFGFSGSANDTGDIRWAKVTITSGKTSSYYYFMQYDVDNLLGNYIGISQIYSTYMQGVDGYCNIAAQISPNDNGKYIIQFPNILGDNTLSLEASYVNGMFVVETPQSQDYMVKIYYGSMIAGAGNQLLFNSKIPIAPVISENNVLLSYASDTFFILGLFKEPVVSVENYARQYTEFPAIILQKN